jgi:hypothetical protein
LSPASLDRMIESLGKIEQKETPTS